MNMSELTGHDSIVNSDDEEVIVNPNIKKPSGTVKSVDTVQLRGLKTPEEIAMEQGGVTEFDEAKKLAAESADKEKERMENGFGDDGSFSGNTYNSSYDAGRFADIRQLIDERNFYEADVRLNAVDPLERNAEWYYLKGLVFAARGWYFEASRNFSTASEMDPDNPEYRQATEKMKESARGYTREGDVGGCNVCDVCSTLMCADCLCEACGGDLIRCC